MLSIINKKSKNSNENVELYINNIIDNIQLTYKQAVHSKNKK